MWRLVILAVEVPDGLVWGIVPVALGLIFAWGSWVTLNSATSRENSERLDDHETRIRKLEAA